MNKKSLKFYYLFYFLTFVLLLFQMPFLSYVLWAIFLMILPIIIYKFVPKISEIPQVLPAFAVSIFILGVLYICGYGFGTTVFEDIVITDNAEQAYKIFKVISEYSDKVELAKRNDKYTLMISKNKENNVQQEKIIITLAQKELITSNVHLDKQIEYKNNEQFEKSLNRKLNRIINQMDGVSVRMSVCGGDGKSCKSNCDKPVISVWIDVDEDADKTYIEKIAKTIILASVKDFHEENIKIEFVNQDRKMPEARKFYKQKKYNEVFKLFSKHPENYEMSIKLLKRLIELDKKIAQNPNDYLLYVERADIKNISVNFTYKNEVHGVTSDYKGAIEDYTKALSLNPKAYEVYEKRGDAHLKYGVIESYTDKSVSQEEQITLAISDYEKAIKYTGGNNSLFEKLGNEYYRKNDYKNAYRIYSMINHEYIFYVDDLQETYIHSNWYLIYKVTNCFVQVGKYDKAIELCNEGIKNIKVKELVRRLKLRRLNLKVRRLFH